ncbi:pyridoxal-phosphate dependent enzyme [Photobacterium leiognathi]|uniref:pyridoxal-phosphate dependent enzyme n=1 Tax=Photobacterium leiognathi TaxID=553611 RepID=UPI001EDED0FB|nr:pyridoxal-phosphate dependent enzyme [Photobacterium leiognathi]MCG3883282.1 pyridoxal-phosphate dependent enzyme [Photobacterium leiognathi]
MLNKKEIETAYQRVQPHLKSLPLMTSDYINTQLNADVFFQFEGAQITGSFKVRGALNTLLTLKEQGKIPKHVVTDNRKEAESLSQQLAEQGATFIHPYDNDDVILGQGTSCYEALSNGLQPDAIFAPIGGGGLISGTLLAAQRLSPSSLIIGGEPQQANDAYQSYIKGNIVGFNDSPNTIADGARTLQISERTFHQIKQLDDILLASEKEIKDWTRLLFSHLKVTVEPTSAVAMVACQKWLTRQDQKERKSVLVILSGGNIDDTTFQALWDKKHIE